MDMTLAVKRETKTIYDLAAELVCRPGMPRKTMDDVVSKALGNYPLWRVRACRLGEAGCFSAAAVFNIQQEFKAFMARHAARAAAAAETEHARQAAADRDLLRRLRDQHQAELQRLNARLALLEEIHS